MTVLLVVMFVVIVIETVELMVSASVIERTQRELYAAHDAINRLIVRERERVK